jgi:plastocyanin
MPFRYRVPLLTAAAFALAACGGGGGDATPPATTAAAPAAAPAAASGTAVIAGKISFEGEAPAADKVKLSADPKCAAMHPGGLERQNIKVKDGGLAEVLVYVKSGAGAAAATTEAVLFDQKGCDYEPHMLVVQAGQPIRIRNSDDTLHNIHPKPQQNAEFNIGQPRKDMETTKTFDKAEVMIPVGCDVHPWMRAYISVLSHRFFAVTGEDGSFEIKGLPAGTFEIEVLHGKLKGTTQSVTVKDGESAALNVSLKAD